MIFRRLQEISVSHYYPIVIDKYFPKKVRGFLRYLSALLAIISFVFSFDILPLELGIEDGLFFLFVFFYLILSFLEFFYRSKLGEGITLRIPEDIVNTRIQIDYALSNILYATDEIDATRALFETKVGLFIMLRAGVSLEDAKSFVYGNRVPTMASSLVLEGESINLTEYVNALFEADKSLQSFLSGHSINKKEFLGAVEWVRNAEDKKRRKDRFWSKENLGAIPSIGTSWSYGVSPELGKFSMPFEYSVNTLVLDVENGYREREVSTIETILQRMEEANVLIIDDDEKVARDIVGRLSKRMKLGVSLPAIEHKTILEFDYNALIAAYKEKGGLEEELIKILNQSTAAGNVILYIKDLPAFATSSKAVGVNLSSLLSPYLASRELQVIATATNPDFHFFIETSPALLEGFERVIPDPAGVEATSSALLEQVPQVESEYGSLFSYPAVLAIANAADRYITYGEMPGKALDLLAEVAPFAAEKGITLVGENDVAQFISKKTGITSGQIDQSETEKIEHLEEHLHNRVIGQNEAVEGIASAMRRARSGITNPKRPLASFLFLGPTGVGKTEVSKALAESFFGDEKKMIRFDMSEYNGADALSRLIGDYATSKSGLLASKIRDNPYGVLLLDEFEKASPDVLDLFLQILDEGVFSDVTGRQVGCRNLIIIATSNAGSSFIWEVTKQSKDLLAEKDNIINAIIQEKIYRPELLNRFDGVILFHPLQNKELEGVAKIGLEKLAKRLKEKDLELVITDDLVSFLVEKGGDPQFGGRSINRAIQNEIEDLIARKIVSGEAKPGSKIEIKREELK